jgi:hypothetical protein
MDRDTIAQLLQQRQADQMVTALKEIAGAVGGYRAALMETGAFTPAEAFLLAQDYHRAVFRKAFWPDSPPTLEDGE